MSRHRPPNIFGELLQMIRGRFTSTHTHGFARWHHSPMKQSDMAKIAGVSRSMIAAVETGRKRMAWHSFEKILDHFGLRMERGLVFEYSAHHGHQYCGVRPDTEILITKDGAPFMHGTLQETSYGGWRLAPIEKEKEHG